MRFRLAVVSALALLPTHLRAQNVDGDSAKVIAPIRVALARNRVTATPPTVQPTRMIDERKDPGTATLLGVLLPGAGQMYAGRTGTGVMLLGLSAAGVAGGAAASSSDKCTTVQNPPLITMTCTQGHRGPLYAGIGVAVASWLYGAFTAAGDARDANLYAQRHARATPIMDRTSGRTELGLAYHF